MKKKPHPGQKWGQEARATPTLFIGRHGAPPSSQWASEMVHEIAHQQSHPGASAPSPELREPARRGGPGEPGDAGYGQRAWASAAFKYPSRVPRARAAAVDLNHALDEMLRDTRVADPATARAGLTGALICENDIS